MFQRTVAINKILSLSKRKKVIQGGTWAGKTYGIMAVVIDYCTKNPKYKVTVVAETIPALKEGAISQFEEIMQETGRWVVGSYNKNELTYTFSNGTRLQFRSFDSVGKAKAAGKRHALFINEGNYIPYPIADALIMRTECDVWIDYNPDDEFWAHTEILPQSDAEFLLLKYTDNQACPKTIIEELQSKQEKAKTSSYWANWCRVYIDGELGTRQGVVFIDGFKLVDSFPDDCKWIVRGLDFGYTNDPTVQIKIGLCQGELFLEEEIWQTGLTNPDIYNKGKQFNIGRCEVVADSSEPKSIQELKLMGLNITGAVKGKDSINNGINLLKQYNINIVSSSLNLIKDWRTYSYKFDRATNKYLNEPEDANNHGPDAVRYGVGLKLGDPNRGAYSWR